MRTAVKILTHLVRFRSSSTNTHPIAYTNANSNTNVNSNNINNADNASNSSEPNNAGSCYKTDSANNGKGLVLGVWSGKDVSNGVKMTDVGKEINSQTKGLLMDILKTASIPKQGDIRVLHGLHPEFNSIAVVGLGSQCTGYNVVEDIDERKEAVRIASAVGCCELQTLGMREIEVEDFGGLAESAAEGSILGTYVFQDFKKLDHRLSVPVLQPYDVCSNWEQWRIGLVKASSQNYARHLMEMPGNLLTPTTFAQNIVDVLCKSGVSVKVKVKYWAEKHGMGGFLGVARGSCEPPVFLELSYHGGENRSENPVILVGSGITFNSGGVCLKKDKREIGRMRGDIGGAACVAAVTRAVAELKLPINLRTLIPLVENMPGCNAIKPGERLIAMDGSVIQLRSSDVAGQLVLADALNYSNHLNPRFVLSVGSSSPGIGKSIGTVGAAAFTPLDSLWTRVRGAAIHTGDRAVRLPLWNIHRERMVNYEGDHVIGRDDSSCSTASFLKQFIQSKDWIHFETDNVMVSCQKESPYLKDGMSGRPTRTLIELIAQMTCIDCK
uniref:Cytosol aminopeptidase n=1 Tax=Timema poppense TaxID=170557 RepID=A0A7R9CHD5_TIMPO|nr:unnamed protein product [Timema poppensis]